MPGYEHVEMLDVCGPYDMLWVPRGRRRLVGRDARTQYVCSVCEGALLLAVAGLLDGYRVTTHWAFIPDLIENYPKVTVADGHPRFVLDRNRLTGGGISSGLDEALKLIELLTDTATAKSVQQTTQYYPDPPITSEIPNTISSPMPTAGRHRGPARSSTSSR